MITRKQLDLEEVLAYVGITGLPKAVNLEKSKRVWATAILEVRKNNGTSSYAYTYNRYGAEPHFVKIWGSTGAIIEIMSVHPIYYLSKEYIPKFNGREEMDKYIATEYGLDINYVKTLDDDKIKTLVYNRAIDAEITFIKQEGEDEYKLKQLSQNEKIFKEITGDKK